MKKEPLEAHNFLSLCTQIYQGYMMSHLAVEKCISLPLLMTFQVWLYLFATRKISISECLRDTY